MKANNNAETIVNQFMLQSEDNYIFACHASIPLLLTPDLLYQIWNNFKQYNYEFDPYVYYRISHIAVSDLLLSPLCKKVGFELYEIKKGCRDILQQHLVANLGVSRKYRIAAFLEGYAYLEHNHNDRKSLRNIHLLTAKSILDPSAVDQQIFQFIRESKTAVEKINYLLLRKNLMPFEIEGNLEIKLSDKNDQYPVLIATNDQDDANVLNIDLPPQFGGILKKAFKITPIQAKGSLALQAIQICRKNNYTVLDLGNCGLTDTDLAEGTLLDKELQLCTHINTLLLCNVPPASLIGNPSPANQGSRNFLTKIPPGISNLKNLELLFCNGTPDHPWGIEDPILNNLPLLKHLDLSNNRISSINNLIGLNNLSHLDLSNNALTNADWITRFPKLEFLELKNNTIKDTNSLGSIIQDSKIKITLQDNLIAVKGNDLPKSSDSENEETWPWLLVLISANNSWDKKYTTFKFGIHPERDDDPAIKESITFKTDILVKAIAGLHDSATKIEIMNMLIPNKIREALYHKNIIFSLDALSAKFPWEKAKALSGPTPLGIAGYMIRNLRNIKVKPQSVTQASLNALLISASRYTSDDLTEIEEVLSKGGFSTLRMTETNVKEIRKELNRKSYRILQMNALNSHLIFAALDKTEHIPEFIFINTSHSAKSDIAHQLIQKGAKAVILLEGLFDAPLGMEFDRYFYNRMLAGDTFAKAAHNARRTIFEKHQNPDYALAYHCYGNPLYTFIESKSPERKTKKIILSNALNEPNFNDSVITLLYRTATTLQSEKRIPWEVAIIKNSDKIQKSLERCEIFILLANDNLTQVQQNQYSQIIDYLSENNAPFVLLLFKEEKGFIFPTDNLTTLNKEQRSKISIEYYNSEKELLVLLSKAIEQITQEGVTYNFNNRIIELAEKYEDIRTSMVAGRNRTLQFSQIVDDMKEIAEEIVPHLQTIVKSKSAGLKLTAISALQQFPHKDYLDWLSDCIGDDEKPFLGFQACLALFQAAITYRDMPGFELYHAVQKAKANILISNYQDPNQLSVIRDIENQIKILPVAYTEENIALEKLKGVWIGHYIQDTKRTNFKMVIWPDVNTTFSGAVTEEGYLGKADVKGEIFAFQNKILFKKQYRRYDNNNYIISYSGSIIDNENIMGSWSLDLLEGYFEMAKVETAY